MATRWLVTHRLTPMIPVDSQVSGYQCLNVAFIYSNNSLETIEHTIHCDDSATADTAASDSTRELGALFELLGFRSGIRPRCDVTHIKRIVARPRSPEGGVIDANIDAVAGRVAVSCGAYVVGQAQLPDEAGASKLGQAPRLHAWLIWFNRARATPDSADAIRNLYLIVEDMGAPGSTAQAGNELRYARHFVSHGVAIGHPAVQSFLQSHNIAPPFQYDPSDPEHAKFVTLMRGQADSFVKNLIETHLV